ncbi:hypothetical protein [Seinonella peptonophila]|uniref:hypothetical protein n=1 Tax=Seinonella peptonophila TaxID=112248 RepID=UPI000932EB20|nr:hypothetical protein [Seinonella peptonophila]
MSWLGILFIVVTVIYGYFCQTRSAYQIGGFFTGGMIGMVIGGIIWKILSIFVDQSYQWYHPKDGSLPDVLFDESKFQMPLADLIGGGVTFTLIFLGAFILGHLGKRAYQEL